MKLFKNADDRLIERIEKEQARMLLKIYDLKKSDSNCPKNAYLLRPDSLHLASYDELGNGVLKLKIGYKKTWSGYVTNTVRMNYNQIVLGSILCEGVEELNKVSYNRIGSIKIPFLSKNKIVNLPVNGSFNIAFKCKNLKALDIDIFVEYDGKLILDSVYKINLSKQLENK